MEDVKGLVQSKTFWGALVAIVATFAGMLGFDTAVLNGAVDEIVAVFGGIFAIYGRIVAFKKIR